MSKSPVSGSTASECFCVVNLVGREVMNDSLQCTKLIKPLKDLLKITTITIE